MLPSILCLCHADEAHRFAPANLYPQPDIPGYDELIRKLGEDDQKRVQFLKACLATVGLEVSQEVAALPPLSSLHLSAIDNTKVSEILCSWEDVLEKENGQELVKGEADTFHVQSDENNLSVEELRQSLPANGGADGIVDYSTVTKTIVAHEKALPSHEVTPRFNHKLYYSSLRRFQVAEGAEDWGNILLYGDVVTSTNSLLEK